MNTYTIGEMAKKLNKTVKTLQNWDKSGALKAYRTPSNRRYYTHEQYLEVLNRKKYENNGSDLDAVREKNVLITGGTGSLGNAITERICDVVKKIVVFSRCEQKQSEMAMRFKDRGNIRYLIGDVKSRTGLNFALDGIDIVIHAAALKMIEVNTYNPIESIKTNILGSVNVLEASIKNNVKTVLFVSSDKACSPISLYGGAKFVAEQLLINGNNYCKRDATKFIITRYGNVFASRGSIKHVFERQKESGEITITHKDMRRFFMSLDDAVDLNLYALAHGNAGEIYIPKLKATTILKFVEVFFPGAEIKIIGLRGYEKINEELINETEMAYAVDVGKYYKIVPPFIKTKNVGWNDKHIDEKKIKPFVYRSDVVEQFTEEGLKKIGGHDIKHEKE